MIQKKAMIENLWTDNTRKGNQYDEQHVCPECGEADLPMPDLRCICKQPMMICIPPGKHIHIHCPVHGDVKIYGSRLTWMPADRRSTLSCVMQ